jgi:hypothetical protein
VHFAHVDDFGISVASFRSHIAWRKWTGSASKHKIEQGADFVIAGCSWNRLLRVQEHLTATGGECRSSRHPSVSSTAPIGVCLRGAELPDALVAELEPTPDRRRGDDQFRLIRDAWCELLRESRAFTPAINNHGPRPRFSEPRNRADIGSGNPERHWIGTV